MFYFEEKLCPLFPAYEKDIQNPACIREICTFTTSKELGCKSVGKVYYFEKICVAIHEAGHIVAILMSQQDGENILGAHIKCDVKQDVIDKDSITYDWSGKVKFKSNCFADSVLETIINTSGIEAQLALGIGPYQAYSGAGNDLEAETKNMLRNTKRVGGVDKSRSWAHQKNEYKRLMHQESTTFQLFTKTIMEENRKAIIPFASALYEKEILSAEEIRKIASGLKLNKESFNSLKRYVSAFYC